MFASCAESLGEIRAGRLIIANESSRCSPSAHRPHWHQGGRASNARAARDMVADAWTESGKATLGYKNPMPLADLESGKLDPRLLK